MSSIWANARLSCLSVSFFSLIVKMSSVFSRSVGSSWRDWCVSPLFLMRSISELVRESWNFWSKSEFQVIHCWSRES